MLMFILILIQQELHLITINFFFSYEYYENDDVPAFVEDQSANNKTGVITLMNQVVSPLLIWRALEKGAE